MCPTLRHQILVGQNKIFLVGQNKISPKKMLNFISLKLLSYQILANAPIGLCFYYLLSLIVTHIKWVVHFLGRNFSKKFTVMTLKKCEQKETLCYLWVKQITYYPNVKENLITNVNAVL